MGPGDPTKTWYDIAFTVWLSAEYESVGIIIGNQHYFDFTVCLLKFLQILGAWMLPLICHFSSVCKPEPRFFHGGVIHCRSV